MNEAFFTELSAWLTQAGLAGASETDIVSGFCDRCVAAGLPLGRAQVFIDTLHPVHEGRLFRWGFGPTEAPILDWRRRRKVSSGLARFPSRRADDLAWSRRHFALRPRVKIYPLTDLEFVLGH
jgi:hypothetical protein